MQPKTKEKIAARKLREQGLSYSEIMERIPSISHSSLSQWVRNVPLSSSQKERLFWKGRSMGIRARHQDRLNKTEILLKEVDKEFAQLIKNPFFNLGLALYWAEGSKSKPWRVTQGIAFSNSDSNLILLMRDWMKQYLGTVNKDFIYNLYVHETADITAAKLKWASILEINSEEIKVFLKRNLIKGRHKDNTYKGLIRLAVRRSTWLNRRLEMWAQATARHYLKS